jgi:hypothetical protein
MARQRRVFPATSGGLLGPADFTKTSRHLRTSRFIRSSTTLAAQLHHLVPVAEGGPSARAGILRTN